MNRNWRTQPRRLTLSRHPADVVRLCMYFVVLLCALVIQDGWLCQLIGATAIVLSLTLQVLRRPPFYRLAMVWELGFLLIVSVEGLTQAYDSVMQVGLDEYNWASRYLVAANAVTLLLHGLTFRERGFALKPWRHNVRLNRFVPLGLILATYGFYLAYYIPFAISLATSGRIGTWTWAALETQSTAQALTAGFALAAGMILPPLIAYYVLWIREGRLSTAILLTLPIFGLQLIIGTRFHFLFPSIGIAVLSLSARPVSFKTVAQLSVVGVTVLLLSVLMLRIRDVGIAEASWETLTQSVRAEELPSHEGTVQTMSMIVNYFNDHDYLYGLSNRGILLFWIPRSLWPEKPFLMGYWLPRAYGLRGIGDIHNVAGSFAADAYIDFGFYGGLLFCGAIGFGFGLLERWCARVISMQGHPLIVIVSTLYGATFFAIRSLDTTIISVSGVVVFGMIFARLVIPRRARHEQQRRLAVRLAGTA